jgi:hypothetical protein
METHREVRLRVLKEGDRLWRLADFGDLPLPAVAKALSRLALAAP